MNKNLPFLLLDGHQLASQYVLWCLDSPDSEGVCDFSTERGYCVRGWALAHSEAPVSVLLRAEGVTRAYPLNVARQDVVDSVLHSGPDESGRLICGFNLPLPFCNTCHLGFECMDRVFWIYSFEPRM